MKSENPGSSFWPKPGFSRWLETLEQVRTFCLAPTPEERGQFDRFNGEIMTTKLGTWVGQGLVPST